MVAEIQVPQMRKVVKGVAQDITPDRRPSAYSNQVTAKTGQTGQTGLVLSIHKYDFLRSKHNHVMDIRTCISIVKCSHNGKKYVVVGGKGILHKNAVVC